MDRFKTIYRPVLKPVRPGEHGHASRGGVQRDSLPRFNFSKKFAEMIQAREEADANANGVEEAAAHARPKHSRTDSPGTPGPVVGEAHEGSTHGRDADGAATPTLPSESFAFRPKGLPRLNLQRTGLLQAPPQRPDINDPPEGAEECSPRDDPLEDAGSLDDLHLGSEQQPPEYSPVATTDAKHEPPPAPNPSEETSPHFCLTMLDETIARCREMVTQLDTAASIMEMDFPRCLSALDEKIALLHNLKLDFMLELGQAMN